MESLGCTKLSSDTPMSNHRYLLTLQVGDVTITRKLKSTLGNHRDFQAEMEELTRNGFWERLASAIDSPAGDPDPVPDDRQETRTSVSGLRLPTSICDVCRKERPANEIKELKETSLWPRQFACYECRTAREVAAMDDEEFQKNLDRFLPRGRYGDE